MRFPNSVKILTLSILGVLFVSAFLPTTATTNPKPVMASYNPAPANNFHAPLSSMALAALTNATPNIQERGDRKSTRLNSSHSQISYAVFCLKKKKYSTSFILKKGDEPSAVQVA